MIVMGIVVVIPYFKGKSLYYVLCLYGFVGACFCFQSKNKGTFVAAALAVVCYCLFDFVFLLQDVCWLLVRCLLAW